jgi:hypothetical protein
MKYHFLCPDQLIPTEEVDPDRVEILEAQILQAGYWTVPIMVEKDELLVMDGHHRLCVARRLQLTAVPVFMLSYDLVRVEGWRSGETITPEKIFAMARSGGKFPFKTTRHIVDAPLPSCMVPLERLRPDWPAAHASFATSGAGASL